MSAKVIIRFLLGAVFLISAIAKLVTPGLFEIAIVEQGLLATRTQAAYPARLLIAFELFLGAALFFPAFLKRLTLPLVILTLSAFTLLQSYQLVFGEQTSDCGCFGELLPMSSTASLLKNFVLLGLSIWLWRTTPDEKCNFLLPALLAAAALSVVMLLAPVRQDYDGIFAKYTQFERAGRVDLTSCDKLIAVFNAECEHCQQTARELMQLVENDADIPKIYVLLFGENDARVRAFWDTTQATFPYHLISENEFFDLIGDSPPRLYWLRHGKVAARWDDNFVKSIRRQFAAVSPRQKS